MNNKQGGVSTILTIIVVILILAGLGSCVGGDNSSEKSAKCQVCHKTFTNSDDRNSIAWRNMCENCYDNYKFSQDLKDELQKYEERYGN